MEYSREPRDKRQANWFWMNKSIVDEYGSHIEAIGIAVYAILARCANEDGHAFPSIRYIARHLGLSTNTVLKYLRKLEKCELITMTLRRDPAGDKDSTEYTLLTPPSHGEQVGVSLGETPTAHKSSSSANKRRLRNEVSQDVRHGVSINETPIDAEVSHQVRHGVVSGETPRAAEVSHVVSRGVSPGETFKDQENKKEKTKEINTHPPSPLTGPAPVTQTAEVRPDGYSEKFLAFWNAYPVKKQKDTAWKAWKTKRCEAESAHILTSVAEHKAHDQQWARNFIPYPATFLNGGGWKDEIHQASQSHTSTHTRLVQ